MHSSGFLGQKDKVESRHIPLLLDASPDFYDIPHVIAALGERMGGAKKTLSSQEDTVPISWSDLLWCQRCHHSVNTCITEQALMEKQHESGERQPINLGGLHCRD